MTGYTPPGWSQWKDTRDALIIVACLLLVLFLSGTLINQGIPKDNNSNLMKFKQHLQVNQNPSCNKT